MIYTFTFSLVVLTTLCLWLIHERKPLAVFFLAPLLLFNVAFAWYVLDDLKGRPTSRELPEESTLVCGTVRDMKDMYILVETEDGIRFYKREATEEEIKNMMKAKEGDAPIIIRNKEDEGIEFYRFDPLEGIEKVTASPEREEMINSHTTRSGRGL